MADHDRTYGSIIANACINNESHRVGACSSIGMHRGLINRRTAIAKIPLAGYMCGTGIGKSIGYVDAACGRISKRCGRVANSNITWKQYTIRAAVSVRYFQ